MIELTLKQSSHQDREYRFLLPESRDDEMYRIRLKSDYLISAGQDIELEASARVVQAKKPRLLDARDVVNIKPFTEGALWWQAIPSKRLLSDILMDVVEHGRQYPRHGTNCACLDKYVWELKAHVNRGMGDQEPAEDSTEAREKLNARFRVAHVMALASRLS